MEESASRLSPRPGRLVAETVVLVVVQAQLENLVVQTRRIGI